MLLFWSGCSEFSERLFRTLNWSSAVVRVGTDFLVKACSWKLRLQNLDEVPHNGLLYTHISLGNIQFLMLLCYVYLLDIVV